jgi:hypothetical protein
MYNIYKFTINSEILFTISTRPLSVQAQYRDSPLTLMIAAAGSSGTFVMTRLRETYSHVLDSNLGLNTVILIIHAFTQSLQVPGMRHRFLPYPFLFMPFDAIDYRQRQCRFQEGSNLVVTAERTSDLRTRGCEGIKASPVFHAPYWGNCSGPLLAGGGSFEACKGCSDLLHTATVLQRESFLESDQMRLHRFMCFM